MSERTFVLIKPDAVRRGLIGEILARYERRGLSIVAMDQRVIDRELADAHTSSTSIRASTPRCATSSRADRWWRWSSKAIRPSTWCAR